MQGQIQNSDRRVPELDGLRGAASIMVVISHYFGEVAHGISATTFGWIGVNMFFVLSGYLIGKLILEKKDCANFFEVFYVRRFLRIIPVYMVTLIAVLVLLALVPHAWADNNHPLPIWTYFAFLQVFPMAATGSIGSHWLAPTWTLAVEEHFYLVVPALLVFTPRRYLVRILLACAGIALCLRVAVFYYGLLPPLSGLVFLPFRADTLICGLLAGLAIHSGAIRWDRYMLWIRITPILMLALTALSHILGGLPTLEIFAPLFLGIGCAAFILSVVLGAPEARRFKPRLLQRIGDNSYCLYLTHLTVLGLMHGLILGRLPDIQTPVQWAVTFASLPVAGLVAFLMTRYIEEPLTRYGRSWKWSRQMRPAKTLAAPQLPQIG